MLDAWIISKLLALKKRIPTMESAVFLWKDTVRERERVPLLPRPGNDSFVVDVTTLFYNFIGAAVKKRGKESIAFTGAIWLHRTFSCCRT